MRKVISLNQGWKLYQNGKYSEVNLPHTWNAVDGQDGGNDYYRGTCRYVRRRHVGTGEHEWSGTGKTQGRVLRVPGGLDGTSAGQERTVRVRGQQRQ